MINQPFIGIFCWIEGLLGQYALASNIYGDTALLHVVDIAATTTNLRDALQRFNLD